MSWIVLHGKLGHLTGKSYYLKYTDSKVKPSVVLQPSTNHHHETGNNRFSFIQSYIRYQFLAYEMPIISIDLN